jgi:hypothetical protein
MKTVTTTDTQGIPDDITPVKLAVMNNDIGHITETLVRLESKFDAAINNFVTSDQMASQIVAAAEKHKDQDLKIADMLLLTARLKAKDDMQQGAIDSTRRFTAIGLSIIGILVAAVTTYLGLHK